MRSLIVFLLFVFISVSGFAQSVLDEIDAIEAEANKKKQATPELDFSVEEEDLKSKVGFSDLSRLVPFSDVAVIQKRYLPKTNRFQASLGLASMMNNPFFQSQGMQFKLGYYLTESWGLEFSYVNFTTSEKVITKDLYSVHGVRTSSIVFPKSYLGADLMFVPFYGKLSWLNKSIVPFDFFFQIGGGQTTTSYNNQAATTIHLGAGQIFAISKAFAARWDISYSTYTGKAEEIGATSDTTVSEISQSFSDLYLGLGLSWFFPEAKYR